MKITSKKLTRLNNYPKINFGYIYFMTERDLFGYPCGPYVKIGLVKGNDEGRSSFERRKEHQTGNPREIVIEEEIKTYAQVSTLESLVHQRLAKHRIHGEWFHYGDDGIYPYVELTKKINIDLENQLDNNNLISQYSIIEDNKIEIEASSEAKDIHQELLKLKAEIIKIKNKKDLATLKLKSFDKNYCRDIEGVCFYEKSKPVEKFDKLNFQKDYPDIFRKLAVDVITPIFNIKKDVKNKKSKEIKSIEELVSAQTFDKSKSSLSIDRNRELVNIHTSWIDAHVALQPLELKKKIFENKLKVIIGENQGIKDICTWKRGLKKQLNKSALIQYDLDLADKYISKGESQIRFKVNDFRPYPFN